MNVMLLLLSPIFQEESILSTQLPHGGGGLRKVKEKGFV